MQRPQPVTLDFLLSQEIKMWQYLEISLVKNGSSVSVNLTALERTINSPHSISTLAFSEQSPPLVLLRGGLTLPHSPCVPFMLWIISVSFSPVHLLMPVKKNILFVTCVDLACHFYCFFISGWYVKEQRSINICKLYKLVKKYGWYIYKIITREKVAYCPTVNPVDNFILWNVVPEGWVWANNWAEADHTLEL